MKIFAKRGSSGVAHRQYRIGKIRMAILDDTASSGADIVADELGRDEYGLARIDFKRGDVIIDIGAHVGMFAIYCAKKFRGVKVLSYEPVPSNVNNARANIELNRVIGISLFDNAVTGDGRRLSLLLHESNTAGATGFLGVPDYPGHLKYEVDSVTLDDILSEVSKVKLLKIDCEGSEYEVLLNSTALDKVEYLSAEIHLNTYLESKGYSVESLMEHCEKFIEPSKITYKTIRMSEVLNPQ